MLGDSGDLEVQRSSSDHPKIKPLFPTGIGISVSASHDINM